MCPPGQGRARHKLQPAMVHTRCSPSHQITASSKTSLPQLPPQSAIILYQLTVRRYACMSGPATRDHPVTRWTPRRLSQQPQVVPDTWLSRLWLCIRTLCLPTLIRVDLLPYSIAPSHQIHNPNRCFNITWQAVPEQPGCCSSGQCARDNLPAGQPCHGTDPLPVSAAAPIVLGNPSWLQYGQLSGHTD